jgi:hypothetical protein
LQQLLIAMVGIAIGFSIYRLPHGHWTDIPLAVLCFYFLLGLVQHALFVRGTIVGANNLGSQQAWGGRLLVLELLSTTVGLILALILMGVAAAGTAFMPTNEDILDYAAIPMMPRDFMVLTLLIAVSLGSQPYAISPRVQVRRSIFTAFGLGLMLLLVILYWAEHLFVWFLVYLAIAGIEKAQPAWLLPPELHVADVVRFHRFATASMIGLLLIVTSVLCLYAAIRWRRWTALRTAALVCLGASLATCGWIAYWIGGPGLKQLSPTIHEARHVPPFAAEVTILATMLLFAGMLSWRIVVNWPTSDSSQAIYHRPFFHQTWTAAAALTVMASSLCIVGVSSIVAEFISIGMAQFDWQDYVNFLTLRPSQFYWYAAMLGGLIAMCQRWRIRGQSVNEPLPNAEPISYFLAGLTITVLLAVAAPIIAAVGFSFWSLL